MIESLKQLRLLQRVLLGIVFRNAEQSLCAVLLSPQQVQLFPAFRVLSETAFKEVIAQQFSRHFFFGERSHKGFPIPGEETGYIVICRAGRFLFYDKGRQLPVYCVRFGTAGRACACVIMLAQNFHLPGIRGNGVSEKTAV